MSRGDVRAEAARVVAAVADKGQSLNRVLPAAGQWLTPGDQPLLRELVYGTLRFAPRLEPLLSACLDKPLKAGEGELKALLLVGLYQLLETRLPDHAVIHSTVKSTATLRKQWAKGLTNAVLRRVQRDGNKLLLTLPEAAAAAHPEWLYQRLREEWPAQWQAMIESNNQRPPLTLRINSQHSTREAYLQQLAALEIQAQACEFAADGITLAQPRPVERLPGFTEGVVSVQDEAAQLAVDLLDGGPGQLVLDACAAPGGKACHWLERHPDTGRLIAMDNDAERLQRITENTNRLGLSLKLVQGDASAPPATLAAGSFDRILCDAPCSGSGVLRRNPDIKLLRRATDIAGFAASQEAILAGLWPLLRPDGLLLYVTCSVLHEENDEVVGQFLAANPGAVLEPIEQPWGVATRFGRQTLPRPGGADGLYFARLRKGPAANGT